MVVWLWWCGCSGVAGVVWWGLVVRCSVEMVSRFGETVLLLKWWWLWWHVVV